MRDQEWYKDGRLQETKKATPEESRDANLKTDQLLKLPLKAWKTDTVPAFVSIAYLVDAVDLDTNKLDKFVCYCELRKETSFDLFRVLMSFGTTIKKIHGWKEVGE